jgi:hypothetical protein
VKHKKRRCQDHHTSPTFGALKPNTLVFELPNVCGTSVSFICIWNSTCSINSELAVLESRSVEVEFSWFLTGSKIHHRILSLRCQSNFVVFVLNTTVPQNDAHLTNISCTPTDL